MSPHDRYECDAQIKQLDHLVTEVFYEDMPNLLGQKVLRAFKLHVADWFMHLGDSDGLATILLLVRYARPFHLRNCAKTEYRATSLFSAQYRLFLF